MIYTGTLINVLLITIGSIVGLILRQKFPERLRDILFQISGLITLFLGIQMALEMKNLIIVVFSLIGGGIIGELLLIDDRIERLTDKIKNRFAKNHTGFTEGFITASLIYCIGSMAILGSIDSGLRNNHTILITKGILDGFMSIVLSSTYGIGVLFSIIPVGLYQGSITAASSITQNFFTPFIISQLTGTGGILIMGLGFVLLNIKKIKVMNISPALILVCIISSVYEYMKM